MRLTWREKTMKTMASVTCRQRRTSPNRVLRGAFVFIFATLPLLFANPAFAGNLTLNANGGTLALGTDFTLTGATLINPARTASF
jgi:hypothetical protein